MKTLHLNLKRKWFDMILSGVKKEEYRELKTYWFRQLFKDFDNSMHTLDDYDFKEFDTITFSNGYTKNRPQFVIELKSIEIKQGNKEWGAEPNEKYFVLSLGEIIIK